MFHIKGSHRWRVYQICTSARWIVYTKSIKQLLHRKYLLYETCYSRLTITNTNVDNKKKDWLYHTKCKAKYDINIFKSFLAWTASHIILLHIQGETELSFRLISSFTQSHTKPRTETVRDEVFFSQGGYKPER